jgi:tetratricopeptide (TPR) repeat protein
MTKNRTLICALLLAGAAACSNAAAAPSSPEESYRKGMAALEAGQPRTARVEFMNALQADPNDRRARLAQARTYLLLGDGVAAESEVQRARQAGVPAGETAHLLAHALLLQGENDRALAEGAGAAPQHAAYAARIRGRAAMAKGDNERASTEFAQALEAAPNDAQVWTDVAHFRRSSGDQAGALQAADRAVGIDPRSVEALTLRGELTRSQYGLAGAIPWFDRALEVDPDNVTALIERASTLGDLGRMQDMLRDSRRVLELSPGHPLAYYLQAMLAARGRDFPLARSIWQKTEGRLDQTPAGMLLASAIDYQTGNVEQAVARLDRLVARQPANRKARRLLAAAQWRKGDVAGTIATLRPLADRPDADSYTLSLIGRALERQGDTQGAAAYLARAAQPQGRALTALDAGQVSNEQLAALRRAAAQRPDHAPTQIMLIAALLARGLGDEALQRAVRVQAANPGVPDAHVLVGDARGTKGDFAGAAEEYRKAANLAFTEPVALRMIEALQRSNQGPAAQQVLNLFLQQNPRNVPALVLAAGAHMQARTWPEAIRIYEGLRRRLGDRDATILNNLAWAYSEVGDHGRAVPIARRAWELDRDNPATADTYGWILFKSGQRAEGLALLERAARGAPSDAEIRRHLEEARRG